MKIPFLVRSFVKSWPVCAVLVLAQCEKPGAPSAPGTSGGAEAAASPTEGAVAQAAPPKAPSLADHADKLGFAGRLPVTTEFYLGTSQLKGHIEALKKSAYWKDMDALVQDKTPAPTAGDKSLETVQQLWGDDVFVAGGAGFAQASEMLRDFNRLYNEVYFRALMTGGTASLLGQQVGNNPMIYLQSFLSDPASLERLAAFVGRFELAPLTVGLKTAKPEDALKFLNDTKALEEKKIFTMSDLTTKSGHQFRVATVDMALILPEDLQVKTLSQLPPDLPEQTVKALGKAWDDLQAKKFKIAWGTVEGYLILATGMNLDHLELAPSPAESLLSRPELGHLLPHVSKNLVGITYANAATINSLNDDQPFVPMLRGVVSSMKGSEMFKSMGEALEQQLAELTPLESAVYKAEGAALAAAAWWDKGLHFEAYGGIQPRFMENGKPLKYARLVDAPGVVFGINYHRNEGYGRDFRAWMEKFVGMLYTGVQELVKAGIAGPQGGQQFAQFETTLLPALLKIYEADKSMDDNGMGSELAFVLDVNGKMPVLPGVPPESKGSKFPRITTVGEVKNREELGKGWGSISASINSLFASQQGAPALFSLGEPISSEKNGVTTYFFGLPFLSGDLLPVASVNDQTLFLSTSKDAAESFAGVLNQPAGESVDGCVWRFDLGALADYVAVASKLSPTQTPEKAKEMQENLKWLKPFRAMEGRIYEEKGVTRNSLSWEISDVVTFD